MNMSNSAKRLMRDSINSIFMLSTPRTIYRKNRNPIYNYRMSFITLTLPSLQSETDVEVKEYLNLFLTDLRRVYNIQNYVWRAELQENGNLHFHLVIDKYVDYNILLNYWLKALRHSPHVKSYQQKFSEMSFKDYKILRLKKIKKEFRTSPEVLKNISAAYLKGKRNNWLKPNCVDVRNVHNMRTISSYLSKYLSKDSDVKIDLERIEHFGKMWGRSTSLSRLKYRFPIILEDLKDKLIKLKEMGALHTVVYEWAEVHYFNFSKMSKSALAYINRNLLLNAKSYDYPIPI